MSSVLPSAYRALIFTRHSCVKFSQRGTSLPLSTMTEYTSPHANTSPGFKPDAC